MTSQEIVSYLNNLKLFQPSRKNNTMGGIEYDDGDCVEKTKKGESLTLTRLINGLWRCPSIDVNMRSRDCHATDALEL